MSRLMQLPTLFGVRGSIATQTMANLTDEQISEIDQIVREISQDEALIPHKYEFMKQLSHTIGGDYKSDQSIAEHEFIIAVWRATVYLMHHRDYSYSCKLCKATEYTTAYNKPKTFDRQYKICPACQKTIYKGQIVRLKKQTKGYILLDQNEQPVSKTFDKRTKLEKLVESPIDTQFGERKIDSPEEILTDKEQKSKWYSVWIWNYFRQILNENIIKTHNKRKIQIYGPAHQVASQIITNELKRIKHKFYIDEDITDCDEIEILTSVWAIPATFDNFMRPLRYIYESYGVDIKIDQFSIKISAGPDGVKEVQENILVEDPVIIISMDGHSNNNDDNKNWTDIVESNCIDKEKEDISISAVEQSDWMETVKRNLPDTICRKIFEIYSQYGDAWKSFSDKFGQKEAAKSHIAKFLEITPKKVEEYKDQIKTVCLECEPSEQCLEVSSQRGSDVLLTEDGDGNILAHLDFECDELYGPKVIGVSKLLGIRVNYAKIEGYDRLIKICDKCQKRLN